MGFKKVVANTVLSIPLLVIGYIAYDGVSQNLDAKKHLVLPVNPYEMGPVNVTMANSLERISKDGVITDRELWEFMTETDLTSDNPGQDKGIEIQATSNTPVDTTIYSEITLDKGNQVALADILQKMDNDQNNQAMLKIFESKANEENPEPLARLVTVSRQTLSGIQSHSEQSQAKLGLRDVPIFISNPDDTGLFRSRNSTRVALDAKSLARPEQALYFMVDRELAKTHEKAENLLHSVERSITHYRERWGFFKPNSKHDEKIDRATARLDANNAIGAAPPSL